MRAVCRVDQLRGDAYAATRFAHRALQNVANSELAPDLLHVDGAALVGEARIAGDHEEPADPGKSGDDLLDHAIDEIFLLRVAAHIGEGQDSDRRLVGESKSRRLGSPHPRPAGHARGLRLTTRASLPR